MDNLKVIGGKADRRGEIFGSQSSQVSKPSAEMARKAKSIMEG